ncbi:UPF0014 membrane protein [Smittium culicis]|uniref:UPF0014 membrane protein n=2 Tax=Smittium culicis TaxID=133412 RepID=A0A1R1Y7A7_9FUNG|nr:UPF0014 membrane protein [Smittium culicis]
MLVAKGLKPCMPLFQQWLGTFADTAAALLNPETENRKEPVNIRCAMPRSTMAFLASLAAYEVTYWRIEEKIPGMYVFVFVSIFSSSLLIGTLGNYFAMNTHPAWAAYKFIPTIGMLLGNTMVGVIFGVKSVIRSCSQESDQIELMLAYGATRTEVSRPVLSKAMKAALVPTINSMSVTGLISIPGMMTGQILAGADVMQAAHYQQIIMFLISATTCVGSISACLFVLASLIDNTPRLRADRIKLRSDK